MSAKSRTTRRAPRASKPRESALPLILALLAAACLLISLIRPYRTETFTWTALAEDALVLAVALCALRLLATLRISGAAAGIACIAAGAGTLAYAFFFAPRAGLLSALAVLLCCIAAVCCCAVSMKNRPAGILFCVILCVVAFPALTDASMSPALPLSRACLLFAAALTADGLSGRRGWTLYAALAPLFLGTLLHPSCLLGALTIPLLAVLFAVRRRAGDKGLAGAAGVIVLIAGALLSKRAALFASFPESVLHAPAAAFLPAYTAHAERFVLVSALLYLLTRLRRLSERMLLPVLPGAVLLGLFLLTGAGARISFLPLLIPPACAGAAELFSKNDT